MQTAIKLVVALVIALGAFTTSAQPLADRVPGDAMVYIAWRGSASMGPGYEGSHLKAVLEDSQVNVLLEQVLPKFLERIAEEDAEAAEAMGAASIIAPFAKAMWKHPSALYIGPVDLSAPMPMPKLAILCQAGGDGPALVNEVNKMLPPEGELPFPVGAKQYGDLVVFTVGAITDAERARFGGPQAVAPAATLKQNPTFIGTMTKMHKDPVGMVYVVKPASPGTGVIAGGAVRIVLESAGVGDILTKSLGTKNHHNVLRAVFEGLKSLRNAEDIGQMRGIEAEVLEKEAAL